MDVMQNWEKLNSRLKEENPELAAGIFDIQGKAMNELIESGSLLAISGETVGQLAARKSPKERYELTGEVGRYLLDFKPGEGMGNYIMKISDADAFPGCIAIAMSAILENFNGKIRRMKINCRYSTKNSEKDKMGEYINKVFDCYPFAELTVDKTSYGPKDGKKKGILSKLFG